MIVMPSNVTGFWTGWLAHRYHGAKHTLGHLFSPGQELQRGPVMQYALDNGAYTAWKNRRKKGGGKWRVGPYRELLRWAHHAPIAPSWILVPDVVGDREATLRKWDRYAPILARFGWPLAFAAQDGMTFADVPKEAAVVFIGGSDEFKASALFPWGGGVPLPRRPGDGARSPAPLSARGDRIMRRHRPLPHRLAAAEPRDVPGRGERRDPCACGSAVVVVRCGRRPDGSWFEVCFNWRTRAYWRREMTWTG